MAKFNPKKFTGRDREYERISEGIDKIWMWDDDAKEYLAPERGGKYRVRKQVKVAGETKSKTIARNCDKLEECRKFRSNSLPDDEDHNGAYGTKIGLLIPEFMESVEWKQNARNTQIMYKGLFERWFDYLHDLPIRRLSQTAVSDWILKMKADRDRYGNARQRKSFKKEFDLLKSLITWYIKRKEDPHFVSPIQDFHQDEYWLDDVGQNEHFVGKVNDEEIPLTKEEFRKFVLELRKGKFGDILSIMAILQYDHSLRICEAAAVMWKDFDWKTPQITFQRHVEYIHRDRKNNPDLIVAGLKNKRHVRRRTGRYASRQESASKKHPFFPCSSRLLKELYLSSPDKEGLVFINPETNSFFEYKCIQNKYDRAFQRAGLSYSGTHIVRYGGVNNAAEFTDDDKVLLDLLGNQRGYDYIRRKPDRLSALAEKMASGSN